MAKLPYNHHESEENCGFDAFYMGNEGKYVNVELFMLNPLKQLCGTNTSHQIIVFAPYCSTEKEEK